ncbi:MAG: uracil-DNA glycosylase family protein [Alphaproteobacteria bacterium]|jgi:uracil-DNA glycosylase family 4|nr:uracil-DNA glycosylase [Candidatus Jidaibacter sp.]
MSSLKEYIRFFHEMGHDTFFEAQNAAQDVANGTPSDELYSFPEAKHTTNVSDAAKSIFVSQKITNSPSRVLAEKAKSLDELRKVVEEFDGCALKRTAKRTVFADGNPKSPVMFIGEAPGANEDEQGIPFCGQSGKLLNIILPSICLKREDTYITNTVFWRPPGNRRPTAEEIEICRPFVEKQIALIKPKLIVLVGSTAVESLLSSNVSMHDLRNNHYFYENMYLDEKIQTFVIFHPSYLLRQPGKKKLMWQDMLKIKSWIC